MSTIRVDDGDSNLFTNGGWVQQQYGPLAYQGTISWSNTAGNSKVARFVGMFTNTWAEFYSCAKHDHF